MFKKLTIFLLILASPIGMAETKYIDARIERVEACKNSGGVIFLFFKDVSGASLNSTNGCSNDIVLPYVQLNSTVGELNDFEKVMLSMVITAQTTDSEIRVRFDNVSNLLVSITIK